LEGKKGRVPGSGSERMKHGGNPAPLLKRASEGGKEQKDLWDKGEQRRREGTKMTTRACAR